MLATWTHLSAIHVVPGQTTWFVCLHESLDDDYLSSSIHTLCLLRLCTALFTSKMAARLARKRQRYVFGASVSVGTGSVTVFRFQYDSANHNSHSVGVSW